MQMRCDLNTNCGNAAGWWLVGLILTVLPVAGAGCSSSEASVTLDTGALLDQYERDRRRHDPHTFSEVDLGEFTVSKREEPHLFFIRFHLYGVIPDKMQDGFAASWETSNERIRSTIREVVQGSDVQQLSDPALGAVKADMIRAINRVLPARYLRDVVFAEFSFERG